MIIHRELRSSLFHKPIYQGMDSTLFMTENGERSIGAPVDSSDGGCRARCVMSHVWWRAAVFCCVGEEDARRRRRATDHRSTAGPEQKGPTQPVPFHPYINPQPRNATTGLGTHREAVSNNGTRIETAAAAAAAAAAMSAMKFCREWYAPLGLLPSLLPPSPPTASSPLPVSLMAANGDYIN
jgi:hypothetical protein